MNARMQLIVSSNLAVQQNNDRLKEVESLGLNDIDKPLVETIKSAMNHKTLAELPDAKRQCCSTSIYSRGISRKGYAIGMEYAAMSIPESRMRNVKTYSICNKKDKIRFCHQI